MNVDLFFCRQKDNINNICFLEEVGSIFFDIIDGDGGKKFFEILRCIRIDIVLVIFSQSTSPVTVVQFVLLTVL